jgi:hypothetical protein
MTSQTSPRITERRGRLLQRFAGFAAAPILASAALTAGTQSADATVGPYVQERIPWGDCTVVLGTVPDSYLRAFGGTDVYCGTRHSSITIKVNLWRWNGSNWALATTSGWRTTNNVATSSAVTAAYSVRGCTWWDITTTVNVDGYQLNRDYGQDQHYFPKWNPTVGNC